MAGYYGVPKPVKNFAIRKGADEDEFKISEDAVDKRNSLTSGDKKEGGDSKEIVKFFG